MHYQGHHKDSDENHVRDHVSVINGVINKTDGTFLQGFFYNEVMDGKDKTNILIGSYPLFETDVKDLAKNGHADAILSLMSDQELVQRGINEDLQKAMLIKNGINIY